MRRLRTLGALSGSFALLGMVGCTDVVEDPLPDGGAGTTTQAVIVVERVERDGKVAQSNISAKFLRVPLTADADVVESIVGSELDLPPIGECMRVADSDSAAPAPQPAIDLFDVGDITIRTSSGSITLAARAFPDVGDRVSGVFYTSPDAASDLPVPGKYVLESSGAMPVDRFAIEAEAPPAPMQVTIGGHPLSDSIELTAGEAIEVRWRTDAPSEASEDDEAYVEIVAENGVATRCAFDDRGRAVLPASMLRDAGFGRLPIAATFALHRVRQGTFRVPGIDLGEIRFDMSVIAGLTLQ
jgi:hypothetical protein